MEKFDWWMFRLVFYVWTIVTGMKLEEIIELLKEVK